MLRAKLRFCEANLQIVDKRATHNRVLAFAVRCPPDFAGFRANPKPARRRPVDDACKELRQHTLQHTRPDQRRERQEPEDGMVVFYRREPRTRSRAASSE